MNSPDTSLHHATRPAGGRKRFAGLMLGSMGVVFGDIGTSPIYGFKTAITQAARGPVGDPEIFGVVSLTLWALIIVVTIKYVTFIMRADNRGEGGILSLMALAQSALGRRTPLVLGLGIVGAAMFYGDAIITPAISVLSAVEGLKTAPGLADAITPSVEIAIALVVLISLFLIQSRGTAKVAAFFGPICLIWFVAIAVMGMTYIPSGIRILWAFNPLYGLTFLAHHGLIGLFVLGSVSLTITGAEALYADMGHFGRAPIQWAWIAVVFPALAINYLGQGAFALHFLGTAAGHAAGAKDQDWFFLMAPGALRVPLVILATAATIIASQAVISGAYSMSNSAMQMGLLPRLDVRRTSETEAGQIYLPNINMLLMVGVILLVGIFKNSDALANAYGLAVTGTMSVTTALAAIVVRRLWKWSLPRTLALVLAASRGGPRFLQRQLSEAVVGRMGAVGDRRRRGGRDHNLDARSPDPGREVTPRPHPNVGFSERFGPAAPASRPRHSGLSQRRSRTHPRRLAAQPQAQRGAASPQRHRGRANDRRAAYSGA